MALSDITDRKAVCAAMAEYVKLGQEAFLTRYGFGKSRGWLLVDDQGVTYDAKAILSAAHGYQFPEHGPLPHSAFQGGMSTAKPLRALGFTVQEPDQEPRNPVWSRDELILALDLYVRHRPSQPGPRHSEVVALSHLLNRIGRINASTMNEVFRNPNGVAMKLMNFRRLDPEQDGKGLKAGARREEEVWALFASDPQRLRATAQAIEAGLSIVEAIPMEVVSADDEAEEGAVLTRLHRVRERDRGIVERRKARALKETGTLACEACAFDFREAYGQRGDGFIECHHSQPVSALKPGEKTKAADLVLLCANCHRIVHVTRPWLSLDQLREALSGPT